MPTKKESLPLLIGVWVRITELETQYGSLGEVAKSIKIDKSYLSRLKSGEKWNPSSSTLKKLGLKKVVSFERIV